MNKILLVLGVLATLFISCSKSSNDSTLDLSEKGIIEVPQNAFEKVITINSNESNWNAITAAEWISLTQSGKTLTIAVAENETTKARKADVLVIAGGASAKLTINQVAGKLNIVAFPNDLKVSNWGGSYVVDLQSNSTEWTVDYKKADWFTLTPKAFKNEIAVEVSENTKNEEREAIIKIVDASGDSKEFKIVQASALYYILPLIDVTATEKDVANFEAERRSSAVISIYTLADPTQPIYDTRSAAFPQMKYVFSSGVLVQALASASSQEIVNSEGFIKALRNNGFQPSSENSNMFFKSVKDKEGKDVAVTATIIASSSQSGVKYDFVPQQPGAMPTFKELPLGYTEKFRNVTKEDINKFESNYKYKGKYNEKESKPLESAPERNVVWYDFDENEDKLLFRFYIIGGDYDMEGSQIITDPSKFYYFLGNRPFMTEEFDALLKKEGYKSLGDMDGYQAFLGNGVAIGIKVVQYQNINSGLPVVDLRFFNGVPFAASASVSSAESAKFEIVTKENVHKYYEKYNSSNKVQFFGAHIFNK